MTKKYEAAFEAAMRKAKSMGNDELAEEAFKAYALASDSDFAGHAGAYEDAVVEEFGNRLLESGFLTRPLFSSEAHQ